jgi:hypothetical protein
MGPRRAPAAAKPATRAMPVDLSDALHWFDGMNRDELGAVRYSMDIARHIQPRNAKAHAAFAAASIAAARAGLCEDLSDDVALACRAAETALELAPDDPMIMALSAPALVDENPVRAQALFKMAHAKLGKRVPRALAKAASEGVLMTLKTYLSWQSQDLPRRASLTP